VRRLYQHRDLGGGEEEGLWAAWRGQQAWRWDFGGGDDGLEVAEKAPGDTQVACGPVWPSVRGGLARGHIRDELRKQHFLGTHLEAEGFAQTQVCQEVRV
jgi:hypothetical protein